MEVKWRDEVHTRAADVRTTDLCLRWTDSREARVIKSTRGQKLYRWRVYKTESRRTAVRVPRRDEQKCSPISELLGSVCIANTKTERDRADAKMMEVYMQLVKNTATKVTRKKLIVGNRGVKWWDAEVKEAIRVWREGARKIYVNWNHNRMGGEC